MSQYLVFKEKILCISRFLKEKSSYNFLTSEGKIAYVIPEDVTGLCFVVPKNFLTSKKEERIQIFYISLNQEKTNIFEVVVYPYDTIGKVMGLFLGYIQEAKNGRNKLAF